MPILEAIVAGTTYTLTDGNPFALISAQGGMAPVQRITDRGPQQHGDSDIDFALDPLTTLLGLIIYAETISDHYTTRDLALQIWRPSRTPIQLRWTLDNGAVRQYDCHVAGQLAFSSAEQRGFTQRCVVPLRAADPTCYDPVLQSSIFGIGGGGGTWAIPWAVPWAIGASTIDSSRAIAYAGTWRSEPIIQIVGPINNPRIENVTTGDVLDFTGTNLGAGTTYTIDCRAGVKTVTDQLGADQIDALTDDSDIATFALEANPEAPGGINSIRVTGTGATSATEVYIQWYTRYIGF